MLNKLLSVSEASHIYQIQDNPLLSCFVYWHMQYGGIYTSGDNKNRYYWNLQHVYTAVHVAKHH